MCDLARWKRVLARAGRVVTQHFSGTKWEITLYETEGIV